jgi:hypothetical protein
MGRLMMKRLRKKDAYKFIVSVSYFSLSVSAYGSDWEDIWGTGVPITRSTNPQSPQRAIPEEVSPVSQQVSTFLQGFPKILKDMGELERHIPTLTPEHRLNPKNVCRQPKSGDWRVLMAWPVKELDRSIEEKIKEIKVAVESLNKKKAVEKVKSLKLSPQGPGSQNAGISVGETDHEGTSQLLEMLRLWFFRTYSPEPKTLHKFLQDYRDFAQWWDDLPPQLMESENVSLLNSLLKEKENNPTMILSLLDDLLVQSLLLKAQFLYEDLLPTFMDLKTSNSTLCRLREEASREDAQLEGILKNIDLYKEIESHIASTIESTVKPLMENCLQQTTDENLKTKVRTAFQQGMAVLTGKTDSQETEDSVTVEGDPNKILKESLQKIIVNVIRETINAGLNQATGRVKKDEPSQSGSYWRSTSNNTTDTSDYSDQQSLTVDIAPIMQTLSEFIKSSDQTATRSWFWGWSANSKNSILPNLIRIDIPTDIQQQWKIPSYRPVVKSKLRGAKTVQKFLEVDTPILSFEESRKEYLKSSFPESDIIPIRTGILKEIRGLRQYSYSPQPQGLPDFINQKKSVRLLFDFPRAYSYVPGIQGVQVLPKILRVFEEYEALITGYRKHLQKTDKSDLGLYLDSTRAGAKFCKDNKSALFTVFSLLDPTELMRDWVSIEVFSLFDRKFLEDEDKGSFLAELEENVIFLPMVEGFPGESLKAETLDISRLMRNAKKILFFKEKCRAIKEGKSLPSEEQVLPDQLFQGKCNASEGVNESIRRMVGRQESRKVEEDQIFIQDRDLLIPFFTDLFRETLEGCLFGFGLTSEKLETLKRLSAPLQPNQPLSLRGVPSSDGEAEVTLHVPVRIRKDSDRSSKKLISSSGSVQKQSDDESGLPSVQKLNIQGVDSLFDSLK